MGIFFDKKSTINSASGFSLIEAMVGLSLIGVVALGLASYGIDSVKIIKKNESLSELDNLKNMINLHLSKTETCTASLRAVYNMSEGIYRQQADDAATVAAKSDQLNNSAKDAVDITAFFNLRSQSGNVVVPIQAGLQFGAAGRYSLEKAQFTRIGRPTFSVAQSTNNQFMGLLSVSFKDAQNNNPTPPFVMPLIMTENSAGVMVECKGASEIKDEEAQEPPADSCLMAGSYLQTSTDASGNTVPGGFVNTFTNDYTCPLDYLPYPAGVLNLSNKTGKYGVKNTIYISYQCLRCPAGHKPPDLIPPVESKAEYNPVTDTIDTWVDPCGGGCGT